MAVGFCQYKDVLGRPRDGFHKARLFGFARNDLLGTLAIAAIIALIFYRRTFWYSFLITFVILMLVAIFLHRLFCTNTTLTKKIFGEIHS